MTAIARLLARLSPSPRRIPRIRVVRDYDLVGGPADGRRVTVGLGETVTVPVQRGSCRIALTEDIDLPFGPLFEQAIYAPAEHRGRVVLLYSPGGAR